MKVEKVETIRIEYGEGVYCDITPSIEDDGTHDFWLHLKGTGESLYMFGIHIESTDDAVEIALANIPDYVDELVSNVNDD